MSQKNKHSWKEVINTQIHKGMKFSVTSPVRLTLQRLAVSRNDTVTGSDDGITSQVTRHKTIRKNLKLFNFLFMPLISALITSAGLIPEP